MRGYFGIGIFHGKTPQNLGTLWRSAYQIGANFIFTIGCRYTKQSSDTGRAWRHIPLYNYLTLDDLKENIPYSCPIIGIEMGGSSINNFVHPERAIYLLGAEDHGLPQKEQDQCHYIVELMAERTASYNVAVAGSLVMYDRLIKNGKKKETN